jgi:hypothetical protein
MAVTCLLLLPSNGRRRRLHKPIIGKWAKNTLLSYWGILNGIVGTIFIMFLHSISKQVISGTQRNRTALLQSTIFCNANFSETYIQLFMETGVPITTWGETFAYLLIRFFAFITYWRKNESTMRQYISCS